MVTTIFPLVSSKEGLEFFEVHKAADKYHRVACEKLLDDNDKISTIGKEEATSFHSLL